MREYADLVQLFEKYGNAVLIGPSGSGKSQALGQRALTEFDNSTDNVAWLTGGEFADIAEALASSCPARHDEARAKWQALTAAPVLAFDNLAPPHHLARPDIIGRLFDFLDERQADGFSTTIASVTAPSLREFRSRLAEAAGDTLAEMLLARLGTVIEFARPKASTAGKAVAG